MDNTKVIITGGCGFIGHHFVEHFLRNTTWDIIVLDKLTYASNGFDRLRDIEAFNDQRVKVFTVDLAQGIEPDLIAEMGPVSYILHLAAETHVDNSIENPKVFVMANVVGTCGILEYAKSHMRCYPNQLKALQYFSTDEVFGPALMPGQWVKENEGAYENGDSLSLRYLYQEWNRYNCTNPYSATKAGGEELALAYANTYKVPLFITHTMNCIGERQHAEKFIPTVIRKVMSGDEVLIHSDAKKTNSGRRSYIHSRNVASGVHTLLFKHVNREKYNIVGEQEIDNLGLAQLISDIIGKPLKYALVDFHSSRPGHDLRYGLCGRKMERLGWRPPVEFTRSLEKTVLWTLDHPRWFQLGKKADD